MDVAARDEDFRRKAHGFGEVVRDGGESGEEEIAEAVAFEAGALVEAMLEELREQSFILAESDDAVADIAGRKHVEFLAQASAGAAIVADGDYGAEIADDRRIGPCRSHFRRSESKALESLEQSGEPGTATDGDHAEATLARSFLQG